MQVFNIFHGIFWPSILIGTILLHFTPETLAGQGVCCVWMAWICLCFPVAPLVIIEMFVPWGWSTWMTDLLGWSSVRCWLCQRFWVWHRPQIPGSVPLHSPGALGLCLWSLWSSVGNSCFALKMRMGGVWRRKELQNGSGSSDNNLWAEERLVFAAWAVCGHCSCLLLFQVAACQVVPSTSPPAWVVLIHLLNDGVHLYSDYYKSITSPRPEEMVLNCEAFLQRTER